MVREGFLGRGRGVHGPDRGALGAGWLGFQLLPFVVWCVRKVIEITVGLVILSLAMLAAAIVWGVFYHVVLGIRNGDDPARPFSR